MSTSHEAMQALIISGRRLTGEEQAALDEHLKSCPACREYAAFHIKLSAQFPAAYPQVRHAPGEVREKARLVQAKLEQRRRAQRAAQHALSLAGAGAALLLFLVVLRLIPGLLPGAPVPAAPAQPAAMQAAAQLAAPLKATEAAVEVGKMPAASLKATATAAGVEKPAAAPTPTQPEVENAPVPAVPHPAAEPTPYPRAPVVLQPAGQVPAGDLTAQHVRALAVRGETVYIGDGTRLAAVDISEPTAPKLLARSEELPGEVMEVLAIPAGSAHRVAVSAGRYLAVFDPSTPGNLELLTTSKLPGPINALILEIGPNRIYAGGALHSDETRGYVAVLDASQHGDLRLLDTLELPAPAHSLALSGATLYAALGGDAPEIAAVPLNGEQFGEPVGVLPQRSTSSMAAVRGVLYLGIEGSILAYNLDDPLNPQFARQIPGSGSAPLPGTVLGFELRSDRIYTAGLDSAGQPFRLIVTLSEPLQTGSIVDTASHIAVTNGIMLVAGDLAAGEPLEIYSILEPPDPIPLVTSLPDRP